MERSWKFVGSGLQPSRICELVEYCSEDGSELSGPQNVGKFLSSCTTGGFSRSAHPYEVCWFIYLRVSHLGFVIIMC
jgi:hypothetical protein